MGPWREQEAHFPNHSLSHFSSETNRPLLRSRGTPWSEMPRERGRHARWVLLRAALRGYTREGGAGPPRGFEPPWHCEIPFYNHSRDRVRIQRSIFLENDTSDSKLRSTLCTKYTHTPAAYKAGCTTDASAARMSGGVAAATGISGTGEGPVGKVPLPNGGEGGTAGVWPAKGAR